MLRAFRLAAAGLALASLAAAASAQPAPNLPALTSEVETLYKARKYAEAQLVARRYLQEAERALGPADVATADAAQWVGIVLRAQGKRAEAIPYFQRVIEIRRAAQGPQHYDVGVALANLAIVYVELRKRDEAERAFKGALAIFGEAPDRDYPSYPTTLTNLATLYADQARYEEARLLLVRALGLFDAWNDPEHANRALALAELAKVHELLGELDEAERLYRRAIPIAEKGFGRDDINVALIRGGLGGLLKSRNRLEEARPLLETALDLSERQWGRASPHIAGYLSQLGDHERLLGRCDKAEGYFARARSIGGAPVNEIPILFSTNRGRDPAQTSVAFGTARARQLSFGLAMISVPGEQDAAPADTSGEKEAVQDQVTEMRRLAIHCIEVLDERQFIGAAARQIAVSRVHHNQVLVYVHGYSVTFENALRRAAQIANDIGFDGSMVVFSWPVREQTLDYLTDTDTLDISVAHFRRFVTEVLTATKADKIHFIAHSMGNLLLLRALDTIAADPRLRAKIGEVVNAAPDVDREVYAQMVAGIEAKAGKFTLYTSSQDLALRLSSALRSYERAGYFRGEPLVAAGFDTLDITQPAKSWFSWFAVNHDVYASDPILVDDMRRLIAKGARPPDQRTPFFEQVDLPAGRYWKLRPPEDLERLKMEQRGGPKELILEGLGQTAKVTRKGADAWVWKENDAVFHFRGSTPRRGELILYDASRDMYHYLYLDFGQTFWRIGDKGPWKLHYVVMSVR